MKRRRWESKKKAKIILEGLKGRPVAELCNEYQISQAQYYQWRDQFMSNAHQVFEVKGKDRKEAHLERENRRLKGMVGELTMELKKSEEELW